MRPAIAFAAKSTADKRGSIPTQLEDCRQLAAREGWMIVDEFTDEGFSAYSGNRGPGLAAARAKAAELGAVLVVQHSDRLARGAGDSPDAAEHLGEIMFWARRNGVELRSVQDDSFLAHPLLAMMMGERNFEDSKRKSAATAAGLRRRIERGTYTGARPFGYARLPPTDPQGLEEHPVEAPWLRKIFEDFAAGVSQHAIARDLNDAGIHGPYGGLWTASRVGKTLDRTVYWGEVGGVRGQHPLIVDENVLRRVKELRTAMKERTGKGRGRRPVNHLFVGGMLRCGVCGGGMSPSSKDDGGVGYRCLNRAVKGCSFSVAARPIDAAVLDYFRTHIFDPAAAREEFERALAGRAEQARAALAAAELDEEALRDQERRVKGWLREGRLTPEEYRDVAQELPQRLTEAAERVARARQDLETTLASAHPEKLFADWQSVRSAASTEVIGRGESLEPVRAGLARLFKAFYVGRPANDAIEPEPDVLRVTIRGREYEVWAEPRSDLWLEGPRRSNSYETWVSYLFPRRLARPSVPLAHGSNQESVHRG